MLRVHVLSLAVLVLACAHRGVGLAPYPMGQEFQAEGITFRRLEHLRSTAAKDLKCPADEIRGERMSTGTTYRLRGCGLSRDYYFDHPHWRRVRVRPDPSGPTLVQPYLNTVRCPACGDRVAPARFCSRCGVEMQAACAQCGTRLAPDMQFCPHCGQARPAQGTPPEPPPTAPPPPTMQEPLRQPVNPVR